MNLLIVDDDPVAVEMLGDVLRQEGHEVRGVGDWIGLMEAIQETRFQAVFLDVGLPGIQGTNLVHQVIALSEGTRVILFSGLPPDTLGELAVGCGADGFLAKQQGVELAPRILRRVMLSVERGRALCALEDVGSEAGHDEAPTGFAAVGPPSVPPLLEVGPSHPPPPSHPALTDPSKSVPPWDPEARQDDPWIPDVVLVDVDPLRRRKLVSWFLDHGFKVHALDHAEAGLGMLAEIRPLPEIFILAASAPGPKSPEVMTRLRSNSELKEVVVILLEDEATEGAAVTGQGEGSGVDQILRGPEGLEKLPKILSNRVRMLQWLRRLRLARDDLDSP